jgi:hypothetical protein
MHPGISTSPTPATMWSGRCRPAASSRPSRASRDLVGYGDGGPASAALLWSPAGVGVDAAGDVFIADTVNNVIREITVSSGNISTVAGGTPVRRRRKRPGVRRRRRQGHRGGIVPSHRRVRGCGSGNLFIADRGNNRIRKVSTSGIITTVAGNGTGVFSGDGGAATSAGVASPTNVAVDASGNIFIAGTLNSRIREVAAGTGIITTVAGDGVAGFYGDGGFADECRAKSPWRRRRGFPAISSSPTPATIGFARYRCPPRLRPRSHPAASLRSTAR